MEASQGRPIRLPFPLPAHLATQRAIPAHWGYAISIRPILHSSGNKYPVGTGEKKVYPTTPAAWPVPESPVRGYAIDILDWRP